MWEEVLEEEKRKKEQVAGQVRIEGTGVVVTESVESEHNGAQKSVWAECLVRSCVRGTTGRAVWLASLEPCVCDERERMGSTVSP